MAQFFGAIKRSNRLVILDRARLRDVQRLLVVSKLAFQLVHFQFGSFRASLVLFLAFDGFCHHFVLLFQTDLQLIEIRFVAFDLLLLTQCGLHQVQVIAGRLIIRFQIAFGTVVLCQLTRHIDVFVLLSRQLLTRSM